MRLRGDREEEDVNHDDDHHHSGAGSFQEGIEQVIHVARVQVSAPFSIPNCTLIFPLGIQVPWRLQQQEEAEQPQDAPDSSADPLRPQGKEAPAAAAAVRARSRRRRQGAAGQRVGQHKRQRGQEGQ